MAMTTMTTDTTTAGSRFFGIDGGLRATFSSSSPTGDRVREEGIEGSLTDRSAVPWVFELMAEAGASRIVRRRASHLIHLDANCGGLPWHRARARVCCSTSGRTDGREWIVPPNASEL